jgi:hypothetical protein
LQKPSSADPLHHHIAVLSAPVVPQLVDYSTTAGAADCAAGCIADAYIALLNGYAPARYTHDEVHDNTQAGDGMHHRKTRSSTTILTVPHSMQTLIQPNATVVLTCICQAVA